MAYTYEWRSVEGKAENAAATAETPIGRLKVDKRRFGGPSRYVAWVRGEVIGRDYISMDTAKVAAENKVRKLMDKAADGK